MAIEVMHEEEERLCRTTADVRVDRPLRLGIDDVGSASIGVAHLVRSEQRRIGEAIEPRREAARPADVADGDHGWRFVTAAAKCHRQRVDSRRQREAVGEDAMLPGSTPVNSEAWLGLVWG